MNSDYERDVAKALGRIEALLEGHVTTLIDHKRRLSKLEVWYVRTSTALAVFTFFTGSGPIALAQMLSYLAPHGPKAP